MNVAARGTLIAHQSFNECNVLSIRRDARDSDLQFWFVDLAHLAGLGTHQIQARNPPVGIPGTMRGDSCPRLSVRSPVVFVDIHIRGRDLRQPVRVQIDGYNSLLINLLVDDARKWGHGLERAGVARHALNKEEGKLRTVGREARGLDIPFQFSVLLRSSAVGCGGPDLSSGNVAGKIGNECNTLAICGPGDIAERKVSLDGDRVRGTAVGRDYRKFSIRNESDLSSIG